MIEFPNTELSRRLRENWGRRLRPEFAARVQGALGYQPSSEDFLDLAGSDRLGKWLLARLHELRPSRTWPESHRADVFADLRKLADRLGDHFSYLAFFGGWEYLGALRVRTADVLMSAESLWQQGREPLCLLTDDLESGFFLDHTEADQMFGADEYELFSWGAFADTE